MAKKYFSVALLFTLISVLALFPIRRNGHLPTEVPKPGGVLRVKPFSSDPFRPQLDPLRGAYIFVLDQLYDGLVRLDNKLNVIPSLAEYWTISEDGKRYVFYLRKGAKFHHGREVSAEDVKFSLERIVRADSTLPFVHYLTSKVVGAEVYRRGQSSQVEGFRVLDPHTFEVQWKKPYVSALYLLSMAFFKILPRELVLSQGDSFFYKPSGTGPFRFAYWLRSPRLDIVGVRLERNEAYFGQKPYLEAVEFSPHFTLEHFLNDEVHIIPYVSERLSQQDCQVLENESFVTAFLLMSCHIPPLDRVSVRRAIVRAIDKKELARAAFRMDMTPQVTHNFIPPQLPGFFPIDERNEHNPAMARRTLLEEGFFERADMPSLSLYFKQPRQEEDMKIFRVLREQLATVGLKLKMKYYRSLEELEGSRNPYLVFMEWRMDFLDPEDIILPLFSAEALINKVAVRYSSHRLEDLLKKAEVERSWVERIALFQKMEMVLDDEVPAIPLFSKQHRLAVQPYVRGLKIPALGFYHLNTQEIWLDK